MYNKHCSQLMIFISFPIDKTIIPCFYCASLSQLTYCTPTKSNLYLANFLAAAVSEPALYRLVMFKVPNLMSLFRCLDRTKVPVQVRAFVCDNFVTKLRLNVEELLAHRPNPSLKTTPCWHSATPQYIRSYPPY
jgi:hypothetical protein